MVRQSAAIASIELPAWARVAGKAQSADATLKKFNSLWQRLEKIQTGDISTSVLDEILKQINQKDFLFHKNKEVRTATALSIAQILRLYAPESPLEEEELKVVFELFLAVLTSSSNGLGKQNGPQFQNCVALLDSLVQMRAFALLSEFCNAERSMMDYFKRFFDLVKPDMPKNVEILIAQALSLFIQHSTSVPEGVVKILIANFHPQVKRSNPAASHLAELIGQNAADELQTYIAQYFVNILEESAQIVDDDERESNLHACHLLIAHIHKLAPKLLYNVLPQLEEEIRAEDAKLRLIAVKTLGHIFTHRAAHPATGQSSLSKMYESPWKVWLTRSWDKNINVRIAWVDTLRTIIGHDSKADAELLPYLEQKLIDPDEKTRVTALKLFLSFEYSIFRSSLSPQILETWGERVKDKKYAVRTLAMESLGRAFDLAYEDLASGDAVALKRFGWIPNKMLQALTALEGHRMSIEIQANFEKFVLPLPDSSEDLKAWSDRFLNVLQLINEENIHGFIQVVNLRGSRAHFTAFIDVCKLYNGGVIESSQVEAVRKSMLRTIDVLAYNFSDPLKAGQDFHTFAKNNDSRTYKLLTAVMDPKTGIEAYCKVYKELSKRLQSERYGKTLIAFIRLAGFPFVNTSSIPFLLQGLEKDSTELIKSLNEHAFRENLFVLVKAIADARAEMLVPHSSMLRESLHDDAVGKHKLAACLGSLASLQSNSSNLKQCSLSEDDLEKLYGILSKTVDAKCAKYGSKVLALIASNTEISSYATAFHLAEELTTTLGKSLPVDRPDALVAALVILRQITKYARDATTDVSDTITESVVKHVLMQAYTAPDYVDGSQDWFEPKEVDDELSSKLAGIRLLTSKCISFADHEEVETISKPVLRLLLLCMVQGEPATDLYAHPAARSHVQLEAALQILKLVRFESLEKMMSVTDFQKLALTLQHDIHNVRDTFVHKLVKYAISRSSKLPPRYYSMMFLVAKDPEEDVKELVRDACSKLMAVMKPEYCLRYFEMALARFIHLMNHHPDFHYGPDDIAQKGQEGLPLKNLEEVADYFDFYLHCCMNKDNIACLHYIANRCKGMRDIFDEERRGLVEEDGPDSIGIHILSDVFMCLIKRKADAMGTIVGDWRGQAGLPKELYVPYINREEQSKVYRKMYLSDEALEFFQNPIRRERSGTAKRKPSAVLDKQTHRTPKRAKRSEESGTVKKKKQTRKVRDEYEEDSSEDEDDGASSEISEDEEVEPSEDEEEAGRGMRMRHKIRQEKRLRNESRRQRREARAGA